MAEMQHSRVKATAKTKLTIRLTPECIAFVKEYARTHSMTVTEVIQRSLDRLQSREKSPIHPEVARFSGLVPENVDALSDYADYVAPKHR